MMKKITLILLMSFYGITTFAQDANKIDSLAANFITYENVIKSNCEKMLDALPTSFEEFNQLWGYDGPVANQMMVVEFLYDNQFVNQELLAEKLVALSYNAHWAADQVTFLLEVIRNMAREHSYLLIKVLNKKTELQNQMFWKFVFCGPHPSNYEELKNKILKILDYEHYQYKHCITEQYDYNVSHPYR